ncbi:MAG: phosphoribosylglycinamide formyltransferase [Clostridiales bacterium]|jgi:phosphoribosylglycinamide formyltransferase-1|nr:phosphoribosylglycinamide formyltransferase [Clostridiales bacterium]
MSSDKIKIAVLVSGGGTNLQALIDAQRDGSLRSGEIVLVVSSNPKAYAINRAADAGIEAVTVCRKEAGDQFEAQLIRTLEKHQIEMIVLAGFMSILSADFISHFTDRIINIHPSLIPSFCGKGMYGLHVHEAALAYGVKVSGATAHYVNEVTDGGKIILQKAVRVRQDDTPESLQKRIMKQAEWDILPRATEQIAKKLQKEKKDGSRPATE